jgi:hypothetical protein
MEHGVDGKLHSGVEWATCLCSSHGPTRKVTYVSASVKRNIVNTNVYNIRYLLTETAANAGLTFFQAAPAECFSDDYAVTHIVDNMIECREGSGVLADQGKAASLWRRGCSARLRRRLSLPFGRIRLI